MVFEVELELTIDEVDGASVVQKMSELVNKAKELGFVIVEVEVEQEEEDEDEDEEESDKYEKKKEE
jgi:methylase of polypeptide subunit release factors